MRATVSSFVVTALLVVPALAHDQVPGKPQERPILLRGGDLYTVANGVLAATDLLFDGGVIRAIGRGLEAPAGAEVIDVAGRRVYPGLIAPTTTLGLVEISSVRATRDQAEVGAITPEVAAHIAYNPDSELIPSVRSHGITTAQVVPQGELLGGRTFLTHLDGWTKEDAAVELVEGLALRWPAVTIQTGFRADGSPEEQKKRMAEARRELRQAFADARAYHIAREAGLEVEHDARWEAMREVWSGEMPVYVAADDYRQIVEALEFVKEHGLRMILVGGADAHLATELLKTHGVPVILGTITSLPRRLDDDYDLPFKLPRLLEDAGVEFCLSLDGSWETRNLPFQAGQAVAFGLSPESALRALTLGTAEILGVAERLGSLEIGKEATLFVSEGDVMETLGQQVTRMFIRGREVDLDNRHKQLYRKYRQRLP